MKHQVCVQKIVVEGQNVVDDVWEVLDKIKDFTEAIRNEEWKGVTGKPLKDVVAIGIGGSFLGPLFVHTALRYPTSHQETFTSLCVISYALHICLHSIIQRSP